MTAETTKASAVHREKTLVPPKGIIIRADFVARKGAQDRAHVRTLAQAVKNHGALDPVLLWRDGAALVLLDGAYRLAAYRAAGWRGDVPAIVVSCDRRTALLLAAGANSKDKVGLAPQEKADLAWRLVREPGMNFSKPELARATGISTATIGRMRARWRVLERVPDVEITGNWWRDRVDSADEAERPGPMSDAQRRQAVDELVKRLRDVLDWRKPGAATRDSTLTYEALHVALGPQHVRAFADWAFGGIGEEEVDEWGSFAVDDVDAGLETDADDNPDF